MNNKERLVAILLNVLALVMLASVIASHIFHIPAYNASGETNMIVFALFLVAASTFCGAKKTENGEGH